MAEQYTEITTKGWGKRILDSFMGVLIGLALFLISFIVMWKTEGRTDFSKIASKTIEISADKISAKADGRPVSVTAPLVASAPIGDEGFLKPGDYITLERKVEMYAWVEEKHSKTEKKVGVAR